LVTINNLKPIYDSVKDIIFKKQASFFKPLRRLHFKEKRALSVKRTRRNQKFLFIKYIFKKKSILRLIAISHLVRTMNPTA